MKKYEVVLDLDGCVFNFIHAFNEKFGYAHVEYTNLVHRYPEKEEEILKWVNSPATYRNLPVLSIGVQIARWLHQPEQDCAVHIVTARPVGSREISVQELRRADVPYDSVTVKKHKPDFIKAIHPDLVIDDIISVLEGVAPIKGVLVKQPYNETPFFPRISTIDQFIALWQRNVNENVPNSSRRVGMA